MTLIVAAHNGRTIVVGADTYMYEGSGEIYRTGHEAKLRVVNNGKWVIGYSGKTVPKLVWDYFEAAKISFDPDIRVGLFQCIGEIGKIYKEHQIHPDSQMLLAGFSREVPYIYRWKIAQPSPAGGDSPAWAGIGCGVDVALHFVWNCQPLEELSTDEVKQVVYFSISEVAKYDNRVDKPIDLATCQPNAVSILPRDAVQQLDGKAEHTSKAIYRMVKGKD